MNSIMMQLPPVEVKDEPVDLFESLEFKTELDLSSSWLAADENINMSAGDIGETQKNENQLEEYGTEADNYKKINSSWQNDYNHVPFNIKRYKLCLKECSVQLQRMDTRIVAAATAGSINLRPVFKCAICLKRFSSTAKVRRHCMEHEHSYVIRTHSRPAFKCSICLKRFFSIAKVRIHQIEHEHGYVVRAHSCTACTEQETTKKNTGMYCDFCGTFILKKRHLARHIRFHFQFPYGIPNCGGKEVCDICGKFLNRIGDRRNDEWRSGLYTCGFCYHSFEYYKTMRRHVEETHDSRTSRYGQSGNPQLQEIHMLSNDQSYNPSLLESSTLNIRDKTAVGQLRPRNSIQNTITDSGGLQDNCSLSSECQLGIVHGTVKCEGVELLVNHSNTQRKEGARKEAVIKYGFKCIICGEPFLREALINHIKTHHTTREAVIKYALKCMICSEQFETEELLFIHIETDSTKKKTIIIKCGFKCIICGVQFLNLKEEELVIHINTHCKRTKIVLEYTFSCIICGGTFLDKGLVNHILTHHITKEAVINDVFKRIICGAPFARKASLINHMKKTHSTTKEAVINYAFKCLICGKQFGKEEFFAVHIKLHCRKRGAIFKFAYKCIICCAEFETKEYLVIHINSHCTTNKTVIKYEFICIICGSQFTSKQFLVFHIKKHCAENRNYFKCAFKCIICGKQFSRKRAFAFHIKTHCTTRVAVIKDEFKCLVCGAQFPGQISLLEHMWTHRNRDHSFTCLVCGALYHNNVSLTSHMKTHYIRIEPNIQDQPTNSECSSQQTNESVEIFRRILGGSKFTETQQTLAINENSNESSMKETFKCKNCGTQFGDKKSLDNHEETHLITNEPVINFDYDPEECDKMFGGEKSVSNCTVSCFITNKAGTTDPLTTTNCDAEFDQPDNE